MAEKINKEMLIELVRNEPGLWNKRDRIYNNRDIKPDLWEKIGRTLNTTGKFAQKSWETLRDSYRKIRKKVQSDIPGQMVKKDISWPHYNAMCFLDDMLLPREPCLGSISYSPKRELQSFSDDKYNIEKDPCEDEDDMEDHSYAKNLDECSGDGKMNDVTDRRNQNPYKSRNKRKFTFEEEALELEKRKLQILESRQMMNSQKLYEADDDYLFLLSLLPYMKKLDDVQKMRIRIDILSSISRELENCKYQEVSVGAAWNHTAYAMPQRFSSSNSSSLGTPVPSPNNPSHEHSTENSGRGLPQGFTNSTGT